MTADRIANNTDVASRRLAAGLAVSLLLHGIVLSLQFGLPERALGELKRITVRLAPSPPPAVEAPVPAASLPAEPAASPSAAEPGGMRIVTIAPSRPEPRKQAAPRAPARRISREKPHPRAEALSERVIASEHTGASFAVPQPEPEAASQTTNDPLALQAGAEAGAGTAAKQADARTDEAGAEQGPVPQALAQEEKKRQAEEADRRAGQERIAEQARAEEELARRREEEHAAKQRDEELRRAEQALAREDEARRTADAVAREQARQADLAREQEEQRRIAEERARVAERLAAQQLAEQQQHAAQQLAEQQRLAEEAARAQQRQAQQAHALEAEQRKAAEALARRQAAQRAAEEQAQLLARQERAAQELAERQRREAELRRQELAERELATRRQEEMREARLRQREQDRLAAQQQAELRERSEEAARQQAEQLAQQRLAQERAQQQEELVRKQRADEQPRQASAAAMPGEGADSGVGRTAPGGLGGGLPRGALGSDMANRARELVRGLGVLSGAPPVARQPGDAQHDKRRMVSTGAERDAPLRLYVDAIRQKIERNGLLNGAQLGAGRVRVDPVVSVAIRSDGSVEDVLIVRSSGRAELDEAVRRIVRLNARYSVFPPNVAAHYDVIEIRRIWAFADGLKLLEELR